MHFDVTPEEIDLMGSDLEETGSPDAGPGNQRNGFQRLRPDFDHVLPDNLALTHRRHNVIRQDADLLNFVRVLTRHNHCAILLWHHRQRKSHETDRDQHRANHEQAEAKASGQRLEAMAGREQ